MNKSFQLFQKHKSKYCVPPIPNSPLHPVYVCVYIYIHNVNVHNNNLAGFWTPLNESSHIKNPR